jgi:hypothetical protein
LLLAVIVGHRNRGRSVAEIDADIAADAKKATVVKKVILPESKVKSDKKLKSIEKPEKTKPTTSKK